MVSSEAANWIGVFDYHLIDDIPVPDGNFSNPNSGFNWPMQALNSAPNVRLWKLINHAGVGFEFEAMRLGCGDIDGTFVDNNTEGLKENGSKKRGRSESCGPSSSKACREKLRRDRLNDKFVELGEILDPVRAPKTDKAAILIEAVRMVTQLRTEAQKLKDSNSSLQEKIKEMKAEKNELRDEKQRLKAQKEMLEQQLKSINSQPSFLPPPPAIPAAFAAQAPPAGGKLVPFVSYPGLAMWQFLPPTAVDTSQDHVLHPPVA